MSLEEILREFVLQQEEKLPRSQFFRYEANVALLRTAMNSHAHEHANVSCDQLQKAGHALCDAVGPEVLLDYLPSFYSSFLPRTYYVSEPQIRQCGTTIRKLLQWLGDQDLLDDEQVTTWRSRVLEMTRAGQQAARAQEYCDDWPDLVPSGRPDELCDDRVTIAQIEPGRLKLEEDLGSYDFGWLKVPADFTEMCSEGMDLAVELQRFGKQWYVADVFNVYPVIP